MTKNDINHQGTPDRIILCSGGKDSAALAHYVHKQFENEQKTPIVVYLDTTVGLSSQRIYMEMLADHYNWYLSTCRTPENFEDITLEHGFFGQSQKAHNDIFQKLKGRWISKYTTISGNPHFYWGVYKDESENRERIVEKEYTDDRGAVHHAPFAEWTEEDIIRYLQEHEMPFNPNWEAAHCTDCCCGSGGAAREERIELEAEGYVVFNEKMNSLEERVTTGDRKETWAWGSFTEKERNKLDLMADDAQKRLSLYGCGDNCSLPSLDLPDDYTPPEPYNDPEAIGFKDSDPDD